MHVMTHQQTPLSSLTFDSDHLTALRGGFQSKGNTMKKSFWLVKGGEVAPATQDAKFNHFDNVLIFARTSIEAALIVKAYEDLLVTVDNVTTENGEVVPALSVSKAGLLNLITHYVNGDDPLLTELLLETNVIKLIMQNQFTD